MKNLLGEKKRSSLKFQCARGLGPCHYSQSGLSVSRIVLTGSLGFGGLRWGGENQSFPPLRATERLFLSTLYAHPGRMQRVWHGDTFLFPLCKAWGVSWKVAECGHCIPNCALIPVLGVKPSSLSCFLRTWTAGRRENDSLKEVGSFPSTLYFPKQAQVKVNTLLASDYRFSCQIPLSCAAMLSSYSNLWIIKQSAWKIFL